MLNLNPLKPNEPSLSYQMDQSNSTLRVVVYFLSPAKHGEHIRIMTLALSSSSTL